MINQMKKYSKRKGFFKVIHFNFYPQENYIKRLSTGIRRSIDLAHKTREYCQQTVSASQMNLLTIIEQVIVNKFEQKPRRYHPHLSESSMLNLEVEN